MTRSSAAIVSFALSCCHADPRAGMQLTPPEPAARTPPAARSSPQVVVVTPQDAPKPDVAPADAAPPGAAPAAVAEVVDATDEQRAKDEVAFENEYLRMKERLIPQQLGKWVAIVDGRLFPSDERGKVAPAATMADCLAAADTAQVANGADWKALHRFIFQIGEEGDVVYADPSRAPRSVVGTALKTSLGIVAGFDARSGELTWSRGERSRRFKFDHERFQVQLSDPLQRQSMATPVADSSGFGGFLLLEAANAALLDGARFEIPGRVLLKAGDDVDELRRTRIRVTIPELDVDVTVPAAAWPK